MISLASRYQILLMSGDHLCYCFSQTGWSVALRMQRYIVLHDGIIKCKHFLLTNCAGNSPATGEFHAQRPVFFDPRLNKRLGKQREAVDLRRHRAHCEVIVMIMFKIGLGGDLMIYMKETISIEPVDFVLQSECQDGDNRALLKNHHWCCCWRFVIYHKYWCVAPII